MGEKKIVLDGYPFVRYHLSDGEFGYRESSYRLVKLYLIEKYGVCYHCGRKVKDYPHVDGISMNYSDMATIDHLVPRPHTTRKKGRKKYQSVEKVLSCFLCNNRMANKPNHNQLNKKGR